MKRYQKQAILEDLDKKMVFLVGPRQAGKTTLAKEIGLEFKSSTYLNYDSSDDRQVILGESWLPSSDLIILDEIHKMPNWKNYLKGVYDTKPENLRILVTGSARLEVFTEVGDSLAGRFFLHHLMPLSPAELKQIGESRELDRYIERGGFPEPFLYENKVDADRWRLQYIDSLLRVDVLDFEDIQSVKTIRLIFELLQSRVGSPVSYSSIAEDVSVSPNTVKKYISILEALYIVFRVTPYSKNIARSLLKEPKIYFFDTGLVRGDSGVKFENLVALCLLKHSFGKVDYEAKRYSLHYLRTKEHREVDFLLAKEGEVESMIEVKNSDSKVGAQLLYFQKKYGFPAYQVVKNLKTERKVGDIEIVRGQSFLEGLYL